MYKYRIFIVVFCFPYMAQGAGHTDMADQSYTGIFHNITPGRLGFYIADINERSFSAKQKEVIEEFNTESIQSHTEAYAVHILKILFYNDKQLFFMSYSYQDTYTRFWKGIDIVIKERSGLRYDLTLKEFRDRDYDLSFAKLINATLFFTFSDNNEILYAMKFDGEGYEVTQYNHRAGLIKNIWLKSRENTEYIFTSEKDGAIVSGVFKITGEENIEIVELYDYNITGYNTIGSSFLYYDQSGNVLYRNGNDPADYTMKAFMGEGEKIYDVFFLEDDSFIITTTVTGPDRFANMFFGSGNIIHYFYYYHVKKHAQNGEIIIKKIRTFGNLWRLEQLICL
jgi:hypothetical protein